MGCTLYKRCTAATFSRLPKSGSRQSIDACRPNQGPSSRHRRRRMGQDVRSPRGPRCIALVGPFQSGKTTLLEAIVALTAATPTFMGDSYTVLDWPGSVEFGNDMRAAPPAVDAAIVVCEADEKR